MCLVCARQARESERTPRRVAAYPREARYTPIDTSRSKKKKSGAQFFWRTRRSGETRERQSQRAVGRGVPVPPSYGPDMDSFAFSVSRHVTRETNTIDCNATRDVQRPETGQQQLNSLTLALATPAQSNVPPRHATCSLAYFVPEDQNRSTAARPVSLSLDTPNTLTARSRQAPGTHVSRWLPPPQSDVTGGLPVAAPQPLHRRAAAAKASASGCRGAPMRARATCPAGRRAWAASRRGPTKQRTCAGRGERGGRRAPGGCSSGERPRREGRAVGRKAWVGGGRCASVCAWRAWRSHVRTIATAVA